MNFDIKQGDVVVVRGNNGCGKSTLLKLLNGENITYSGNLYKNPNLITSYVSQSTSSLSGNLKDFAFNNKIDESLFKAILRKLDFSRNQFEKNIEDFSEGQKKKVLIARSLCQETHLYIWDEPLNYIDVMSRIQIENLILSYKPTMILVEHDKLFTDTIAANIINM